MNLKIKAKDLNDVENRYLNKSLGKRYACQVRWKDWRDNRERFMGYS